MADFFPNSELVFDSMSKIFRLVGNLTVLKKSGMGSASFMKWGINNPKEIEKWDPRIKIIDVYQVFSGIGFDETAISREELDKIRNTNRLRGLPIIHLKMNPNVASD
jgi:hypothetical protein